MEDILTFEEDTVTPEDNRVTLPLAEIDEPDGPLTFGAMQSSLVQYTAVGSITNNLMDYGSNLFREEDEEFMSTVGDKYKDLVKKEGFTEQRAEYITDNAKNERHYWELFLEQRRQQDNAEALERSGAAGIIFSMGAEITEGIALIGGLRKVAPGMITKLTNQGTKLFQKIGLSKKASKVLTGISGGVTVETLLEYPKHQVTDSDRTEMDYLVAGLAGTFGGVLSVSSKPSKTIKPSTVSIEATNLNKIGNIMAKQANEALEHKKHLDSIDDPIKKEAVNNEFERNKVQKFLEYFQFDYNRRFETSKSQTMRNLTLAGDNKIPIFYNPRFKTVDNFSAEEINSNYRDSIYSSIVSSLQPVWHQYLELKSKKVIPALNRLQFNKQNDFYKYAGEVVHGFVDESNLPKEVLDLHKEIKKANAEIAENAYEQNIRYGHPLFKDGTIPRNPDYLPIKYNVAKVVADISNGTISSKDYINLIANGLKGTLRNSGVEAITEEQQEYILLRAKNWLEKQQNSVRKPDFNSFVDKSEIIDDYENFVESVKDNMGLTEEQARQMARQEAELTGNPSTLSPRIKRRSNIDLTATHITEQGKQIALSDYVETNLDMLWYRYAQSMGGDNALRKMGINSRTDIKKLRETIKDELLQEYGKESLSVKADLAVFDDTMKQFLGDPLLEDPDNIMNKMTETLLSGARVSYLGNTWLAMMPEIVSTIAETGLRSITKYPTLKDFAKGYTKGTQEVSNLTLEARIFNSLGEGAYKHSNRFLYEADNFTGELASVTPKTPLDKLDRGVDIALGVTKKAEEVVTQLGGSKAGQALLEKTMSMGISSKLLKYVNKGKIPDSLAKEFGWSPKTAERIRQNILKYADIEGDSVDVFNFHLWDVEDEIAFNLGLRRYSHTLIQTPNIGDTPAIVFGKDVMKNTWGGKLVTSILQYPITAHSKQLGRTLANPDMTQFNRTTWQLIGAYLGTVIYNYATFSNDPVELEKRMEDERLISDTMFRHPTAGIAAIGVGTYESLFNEEITPSTAGRGLSTPPAVKLGKGMVDTFSIASGFLDDDKTVTKKRFNSYLNTMLPNLMFTNYLYSKMAEEATVEEEFVEEKDFLEED